LTVRIKKLKAGIIIYSRRPTFYQGEETSTYYIRKEKKGYSVYAARRSGPRAHWQPDIMWTDMISFEKICSMPTMVNAQKQIEKILTLEAI